MSKVYYHFNADGTLGYVGFRKMRKLIKGWGWKREDFVNFGELKKLFKLKDRDLDALLKRLNNV